MTKTLPKFELPVKNRLVFFGDHSGQFIAQNPLIGMTRPIRRYDRNTISAALNDLLQVTRPADLPYAVVADYELMSANNFTLIKTFRANPLLRNVPLIALIDAHSISSSDSVKAGIDDVYPLSASWNAIEERIKFLHEFKPLMNQKSGHNETLGVRVPLAKRAVDIAVSSAAIILLSPLFLLIGILIKLESRGPVVYRSKRAGMGYQVFDFLKFRSMYADADQRLKELAHLNQYDAKNGDVTFVKFANDPRVTRVGRIIRKTSIDELPQLFNILKGDMSLIGNRPLPLYEAEQLTKDEFTPRFIAPAGLTGLWQVTKRGRADMSVEERIGLDVRYAQKHSLKMDLHILLKTIPAMIQKENV